MKIEYKYPFIYFFFLPPYSLERSKSSEVESGSVVLEFQNRTSGLHKALNTKHKKAKVQYTPTWFFGFMVFGFLLVRNTRGGGR